MKVERSQNTHTTHARTLNMHAQHTTTHACSAHNTCAAPADKVAQQLNNGYVQK